MANVAICGEVFSPNLGDGVIFESIRHLFLSHGVETTPVDLSGQSGWAECPKLDSGTTEHVGRLRRLCRIPMRRSRTLRRLHSTCHWYARKRSTFSTQWEEAIASADAVVIGGGQLLTDINFRFAPRIHEIAILAKRHNKPIAVFGCGAGSAGWGLAARKMYSWVLEQSCYISVRDHESAAILRRHLPQNAIIHVHPDPAFAVANLRPTVESTAGKTAPIGFNVQPALHFRTFVPSLRGLSDDTYYNFWVNLIRGACDSGETALLLTNGDPEDYRAAGEIERRLSSEGYDVGLAQRPLRPEQLISQIEAVSALVSTRMHAGIIGYGLGKSVVPISWDKKVDAVWNSIGAGELVVDADILLRETPTWPEAHRLLVQDTADRVSLEHLQESIKDAVADCLRLLEVAS